MNMELVALLKTETVNGTLKAGGRVNQSCRMMGVTTAIELTALRLCDLEGP